MKPTYRFVRTAVVKVAADAPAALQFGREVCAHLNRKHGLAIRCGVEVFDKARIHWYSDADSLEKFSAVFADMMQDREYLAMVEKSRALWVEGTLKDNVVALFE
jgi:hypothetical protein